MNKNIEIVYVPIDDLQFADYNPRTATAEQSEQLEKNIREFGFVDPILVNSFPDRKNIIIGGHFRVRIAQKIGLKEIPVVYVNIPTLKKEKELNIRLNKNTGSWDFTKLANFFENNDLIDWGFKEEEFGFDTGMPVGQGSGSGQASGDPKITLSFEDGNFAQILEAFTRAKEDMDLDTNELVILKLLEPYL